MNSEEAFAERLRAMEEKVNLMWRLETGGDADTVDGIHAASTPVANKLLALGATARFTISALPAGLTGYVLRGKGAAADPAFEYLYPRMAQLAYYAVGGSAEQNIDIIDLDINTARLYLLTADIKNANAGTADYAVYMNADYTATNYYCQTFYCNGAVTSATRNNDANVMQLSTGCEGSLVLWMFRNQSNQRVHGQYYSTKNVAGSGGIWGCGSWANTTAQTNVTSIRIAASVASGMGAYSRFNLFGVHA